MEMYEVKELLKSKRNGKYEGKDGSYFYWKNHKLTGSFCLKTKKDIIQCTIDENNYGEYKVTYKNGQLKFSVPVINNKHHGTSKFYREDGSILLIEEYKKGKLDGISHEYDKEGKIKNIYFYKKGHLVAKTEDVE